MLLLASHPMRLCRIGCDYFPGGLWRIRWGPAPGVARLHLADGMPLLRPEEQVFSAMLDGWRNQLPCEDLEGGARFERLA